VEPSGYTSTSYNWASGTENYGDRAGIDRHPGVSGRGSHVGLRRRRTIASIRPGPNLRKTISYEGENCGGLHFTAGRTREFGIRVALGSSPRRAVGEGLREGLLLTGIGVGIGLALSAAAGRVFGSFLFDVTPTDASTYFVVTGLLAAVSLLACCIPAQRAGKVDPMQALRAD